MYQKHIPVLFLFFTIVHLDFGTCRQNVEGGKGKRMLPSLALA